MRSTFKFCFILALLLSPRICLSQAADKHPTLEVSMDHVYLDSNYVLCGTGGFGLFVFDRRTESWENYFGDHKASSIGLRTVTDLEKEGNFIHVTFNNNSGLRFDLRDGSYEQAPARKQHFRGLGENPGKNLGRDRSPVDGGVDA
jgi:hypothetical protein